MTRHMDRIRRETIEQLGPAPATPIEALTHVLGAFADAPDDRMALEATSGIYGDGVHTGLTMGDLRALAALIPAGKPTHRGPGRPASELPDWAIIQLSERGMDAGDVTHFIASGNERTITAAIDGKPIWLTRT